METKESLKKEYDTFLREGQRLLEDGKIDDLSEYLEEKAKDLSGKSVIRDISITCLSEYREHLQTKRPGLKTGYPSLDAYVSIPQGAVTIIAGKPSHGKTTLLLNLFINCIEQYKDKHFVFFTYEQTKYQIFTRLITRMSGVTINPFKNAENIENYIRGNNKGNEEINKALNKFDEFTRSGRLLIINEHYNADELADTITYLSNKYPLGAVFIDYIQKITVKGTSYSRQNELQKVSDTVLKTSIQTGLPIVLGAQFNREATSIDELDEKHIREAGDIANDANTVLGIWNVEKGKRETPWDNEPYPMAGEFKIKVMKNRDGIINKIINLTLEGAMLTIRERNA
jgi:replicative DNA helicase